MQQVGVQQALDAATVRRWCAAARDALGAGRVEIDGLNVYPVPDRDTGTNLYLTMDAAASAADRAGRDAPDDAGAALRAAARGALLGARGNSGVILSQLLRGAAERLAGGPPVSGRDFADALGHAADLAYAAVARPVEGTILSVARAAAVAAQGVAGPAPPLFRGARAAARGAREALERTPEQLDVLRAAGVVDAGGRGLVVVLDAFDTALTGWRPVPGAPAAPKRPAARLGPEPGPEPGPAGAAGGPAYEVMYLLDARAGDAERLRSRLDGLGSSVLVVGGDGLWNVHAHVDDVAAAIEAGIAAGRPHRLRVTRFADGALGAAPAAAGGAPERRHRRAVLVLASGDGPAELFRGAGADVVVAPDGRPPTGDDLLTALRASAADEVVLLPNARDARPAAEAAAARARLEHVRVAVIPTHAYVQGIAALAVHEPAKPFDEDVVAMTTAAGHTRHGAVTMATRDAVTSAGRCRPGDVLGAVQGDFVIVGADRTAVAVEVVERMLSAGGELVTLVAGRDGGPELAADVVTHLRATRPDIDTAVHHGDQDRYPLLVGVE